LLDIKKVKKQKKYFKKEYKENKGVSYFKNIKQLAMPKSKDNINYESISDLLNKTHSQIMLQN